MPWSKKGLIFEPSQGPSWMVHHACIPTVDLLNDDIARIYFSPRDADNRSMVAFLEVAADNPAKILRIHDKPILLAGVPGTFDSDGVMPASIVNYNGVKYLYYSGWNQSVSVPYRNAVGVAVSQDGIEFTRLFEGPVVDRGPTDPFFIAAPHVMLDDDQLLKIWYPSGTGWVSVNGKLEPRYHIKYAESHDGINWTRPNVICIEYGSELEANARPCVIKEESLYKMWYCYRGSINYRTDKAESYRLGYAESLDGIHWTRQDDRVGIDRSETGWDSQMMEYPNVYVHHGKKYLLYNGNGFGTTGFGYAVWEDEK